MEYAAGGVSSYAALNASIYGIKKLQDIKLIISKLGIDKGTDAIIEILKNIHIKVIKILMKYLQYSQMKLLSPTD